MVVRHERILRGLMPSTHYIRCGLPRACDADYQGTATLIGAVIESHVGTEAGAESDLVVCSRAQSNVLVELELTVQ